MAMSMNVKDYMKIYDGFLDLDFCKTVVSELESNSWQKHSFYTQGGNYISYDDDLSISYSESENGNAIGSKIWFAIQQYIVNDFKHCNSWFSGWGGYTKVRFNKYEVGTKMALHCDHIHSMFDGERKGIPTLSVLGALNDDYEGGELVFWDSEVIKLKAGQIMLFPSNFMYPHTVTTLTKGTRYSYVSWVW
jgi:2OG-Fe(II) oxygenase superfamily